MELPLVYYNKEDVVETVKLTFIEITTSILTHL